MPLHKKFATFLNSLPGRLIVLLLFLYLLFRLLRKKQPAQEQTQFQQILNRTLQKSKYSKLSKYWFDVAKMETAGFTSKLFLNSNNPWGMQMPGKRQTTAQGEVKGVTGRNEVSFWEKWFSSPGLVQAAVQEQRKYAAYPSLEAAAQDIVLYMDHFGYPTASPSLLTFIQTMKKFGFFGSESVDSYYNKVKAWQTK